MMTTAVMSSTPGGGFFKDLASPAEQNMGRVYQHLQQSIHS